MGKKGKTTENTNQKLGLAIKSGKHKVGKYTTQTLPGVHVFAQISSNAPSFG